MLIACVHASQLRDIGAAMAVATLLIVLWYSIGGGGVWGVGGVRGGKVCGV